MPLDLLAFDKFVVGLAVAACVLRNAAAAASGLEYAFVAVAGCDTYAVAPGYVVGVACYAAAAAAAVAAYVVVASAVVVHFVVGAAVAAEFERAAVV